MDVTQIMKKKIAAGGAPEGLVFSIRCDGGEIEGLPRTIVDYDLQTIEPPCYWMAPSVSLQLEFD